MRILAAQYWPRWQVLARSNRISCPQCRERVSCYWLTPCQVRFPFLYSSNEVIQGLNSDDTAQCAAATVCTFYVAVIKNRYPFAAKFLLKLDNHCVPGIGQCCAEMCTIKSKFRTYARKSLTLVVLALDISPSGN